MTRIKDQDFEKVWGFSSSDLLEGKVGYTYEDWFKDLDQAIRDVLHRKQFREGLARGLNNVEAAEQKKQVFLVRDAR